MSLLLAPLFRGQLDSRDTNRWKIHKFGGSSLADADCFRRVAAILTDQTETSIGAVVSAMAGMTDKLLQLTALAEQG